MNSVEPIRDAEKITDIGLFLKNENIRDYVLFMTGIYSGLRISDLLKLRVSDVRNQSYIYIREQKTNKERRIPIHKDLLKIFKDYTEGKQDYEYLFKSRHGRNKPISRMRAYQILNNAAEKFGLKNIGTHTMRKTFGYFLYKETKDVVGIKMILNHSDISHTLRYIGVAQENAEELMRKLTFKR